MTRNVISLSSVLSELEAERNLDRAVLADVVREGLIAAYTKKYPDVEFAFDYDFKTNTIDIGAIKTVVSSVEDDDQQISLRKARGLKPNVAIGEQLNVPFIEPIGRIEILKAKQVISHRIRAIDAEVVYKEFKPKEGTLVYGVIHKCERAGTLVKLQDALGFLPKSLSIPTEKCTVGFPIRAIIKEVFAEPRNDNQIILDRASSELVRLLFELEIPEVYERIVEIKKVVRIPGYKSKVLVASHDENIDPVGTCVGVGGVRIRPILRELSGEKIDIISTKDSLEELIKVSLKPAVVNQVELLDKEHARVWVDNDQRSVAIGKNGYNIRLASQLVGLEIELAQTELEKDIFKDDTTDLEASRDEPANPMGDNGSAAI